MKTSVIAFEDQNGNESLGRLNPVKFTGTGN